MYKDPFVVKKRTKGAKGGGEKERMSAKRETRCSPTTSIMHKREIGPHYRHAAAFRLISRHSFCANAMQMVTCRDTPLPGGREDRSDSVLMSERERRQMDGTESESLETYMYIA